MAAHSVTAAYTVQKAQRELEDLQLVLRARNGDEGAMDSLLRRYHGFVRLKASSYFLAGRRVAEGDVGVQRLMLEARRCLDRRDDLPGDAQLREAAKRGLLVGAEVANRLVKPDQAFLDEVFPVAAGQEVRARLQPNEAGVPADEVVHRAVVAVPCPDDELQILELALRLLLLAGTRGWTGEGHM